VALLSRLVTVLASTASACTLVSGLGDLEVAPLAAGRPPDARTLTDGATISSTPDGSTLPPSPTDAGDSQAPVDGAVVAIAVNDSFEAGNECVGWEPEFANATPASPGFAGARSCRVCQAGADVGSLHKYLPIPDGSWTLTAQVHGGAGFAGTTIAFGGFDTATENILGSSETQLINGWSLLQASFTTRSPSGSTALEIFFEGFSSQACYLVDEVKLARAGSP
jgi:hypothetical protein